MKLLNKNFVIVLFSVMVVGIGSTLIPETASEDAIIKGDVTGDGYVRVNDIIKINNHIIGKIHINNSSELLAADVTGDGNVRVNDIIKINNHILNPLSNPL